MNETIPLKIVRSPERAHFLNFRFDDFRSRAMLSACCEMTQERVGGISSVAFPHSLLPT